jgi:hypothetical protein
MQRKAWLLLGAGSAATIGLLVCGLFVAANLFGGSAKFSKPEDCKTPFVETKSCRGEDSSFQECYWFFRAEGVPDRAVCQSYLRRGAPPFPSARSCDARSPQGWQNIPCAGVRLSATSTCFACRVPEPEAARHYVQAFDSTCTQAILLAACNAPIERAIALGEP